MHYWLKVIEDRNSKKKRNKKEKKALRIYLLRVTQLKPSNSTKSYHMLTVSLQSLTLIMGSRTFLETLVES